MYWVVYWQNYLYDENGVIIETKYEVECSNQFDEFGSAFGHFVLACGDKRTARVYVKVYCEECDKNGDIVCAYSNKWNDIKMGE